MATEHRRRPPTCPPWCDLGHGTLLGEDDTVHISRQLCVRNTLMRLCATIDPATGEQDGPYVLLGTQELDLTEVEALIAALSDLAGAARSAARDPTAARGPGAPALPTPRAAT